MMAGLGKKVSNMNSQWLRFGLETLSKAALIDLVADLARKQTGELASDLELAALIDDWHAPVAMMRGDKFPAIVKAIHKFEQSQSEIQAYIDRDKKPPQA